jgi:hypothetical protein
MAGTAAMTVSSTIEAKLRGRAFSTAPAQAAARALAIETFDDGAAYARFSNLVHWRYGTGWGVASGVLRSLGISPRLATPAHFAAIWGSSLYTLPKYEVAPPRDRVGGGRRGNRRLPPPRLRDGDRPCLRAARPERKPPGRMTCIRAAMDRLDLLD